MSERCAKCGGRLYRDESQLGHEYSGRCVTAPAAKPKAAPNEARPGRSSMSRAEYLEAVKVSTEKKVATRRAKQARYRARRAAARVAS